MFTPTWLARKGKAPCTMAYSCGHMCEAVTSTTVCAIIGETMQIEPTGALVHDAICLSAVSGHSSEERV